MTLSMAAPGHTGVRRLHVCDRKKKKKEKIADLGLFLVILPRCRRVHAHSQRARPGDG